MRTSQERVLTTAAAKMVLQDAGMGEKILSTVPQNNFNKTIREALPKLDGAGGGGIYT